MDKSPLQNAIDWFAAQDDVGGFETVGHLLFPEWIPKRSCRAPHREDENPSFSVYQNPSGKWCFKDHGGTGEQGGLVDLAMLAGMDQRTAARWLIEKAGFDLQKGCAPVSPAKKSRKGLACGGSTRPAACLPAMPAEVSRSWMEGVGHLQSSPNLLGKIAASRGWPVEFARHLAETMKISAPLYHRQRTLAFPVFVPEPAGDRCVSRMVGYHARLNPAHPELRASWRFVPNQREHGQTTPSLPFLLGSFDSARLLIITEGQWDALTFGLAAGWLGEGCHWPDHVCLIGMRGASGANTFFRYYTRFWPDDADCLLLPDNDEAGKIWFTGPNAIDQRLARLCRKVVVESCAPHKDFNDLYKAGMITQTEIADLIGRHFCTKDCINFL